MTRENFRATEGPLKVKIAIDLDYEAATALATINRRSTPDDADALTARWFESKAWCRASDTRSL